MGAIQHTHTLQYFAADVYARTHVYVGEGCTGEAPADDGHDHTATSVVATSSATSSAPSTTSADAVVSSEAAGTLTSAAPQSCREQLLVINPRCSRFLRHSL